MNGKIIASKHNPARTGTKKPTDCTETFKPINSMQRNYTCADIDVESYPMKMKISRLFKFAR